MHRALLVLGLYLLSTVILWWPRLRAPWRRGLALAVSAAGLWFLVLAMGTEGLRESQTETVYIVGARYVTGQASASASLPYYICSAACLLLGTAGLALGDERVRALARHWLPSAVLFSIAITCVRFLLEKAATPPYWTEALGVVWLAPLVGAYFAVSLRGAAAGLRPLLRPLALYALTVRGFIAALYVAATSLELGTHFDLTRLTRLWSPLTQRALEFSPGSLDQILTLVALPQLVLWPLFTVALGLGGAALAVSFKSAGSSRGGLPTAPDGNGGGKALGLPPQSCSTSRT